MLEKTVPLTPPVADEATVASAAALAREVAAPGVRRGGSAAAEMRALVYPDWERLELRRVLCPTPERGEVLVRVAACGLCGSELETFQRRSPRRQPPLIMGHEFCGHIERLGPDVEGWEPGQPVISNAVVSCGKCICCRRGDTHLCEDRQVFGMHRPGAFAEFVAVPQHALIDWPRDIPATEACLSEPLANGVHVAKLTAHLAAEHVLVIGAGPIGLMCQQVMQIRRQSRVVVTDLVPERLRVAETLGAAMTCDARQAGCEELLQASGCGGRFDLVIDAVGSGRTKAMSIRCVRPGGAAVWIGLHENSISLDSYDVTLGEKQILGTYSATTSDLEAAVQLLRDPKCDVRSWIQKASLDDGVTIFNRMLRAQGHDIKAVFVP